MKSAFGKESYNAFQFRDGDAAVGAAVETTGCKVLV